MALLQPDSSALLEVNATNRGFLPPRLTLAQRDSINNPATGLVIYNTDLSCLQVNNGNPTMPLWQCFGVSPSGIIQVTQAPSTSCPQLLHGWQQNVVFATFNLTALTDGVKLTHLYITPIGANLPQLNTNNWRITDGVTTWSTSAFGVNNSVIFDWWMNDNPVIPLNTTKTYTFLADIIPFVYVADTIPMFKLILDTASVGGIIQVPGTVNGIRAISLSNSLPVNTVIGGSTPISPIMKIVRGRPIVSKINITPSNTEFARFEVGALGNNIWVTGLQIDLVNVQGGNNGNIIYVYKNSISASNLVYTGPAGSIAFNQPGSTYVEVIDGLVETFIVKVNNPTATMNGPVPNPYGATLLNLIYLDKLNDGDVPITNVSSFCNTGNWPLIWSN